MGRVIPALRDSKSLYQHTHIQRLAMMLESKFDPVDVPADTDNDIELNGKDQEKGRNRNYIFGTKDQLDLKQFIFLR